MSREACPYQVMCIYTHMASMAQRRNIELGVDLLLKDPWALDEEIQDRLALHDVNVQLFEQARQQYKGELPPIEQRCGSCAATLAEIEANLE